MGKFTFDGWAKPGDVPPFQGAFVTGANLRSSLKTKLTTPPSREVEAKAPPRPEKTTGRKTSKPKT